MTTIQDALITAVQSRNEGNFGFALTIAQRVVASDPAQFDAWCLLGDVSRRLGDLEQSAGAYRNAIALRLALHGREILPTDGTICDLYH